MVSGRVKTWLKEEGEYIGTHELVAEIETESLMPDDGSVEPTGQGNKTTVMLLEVVDDGYVARRIAAEGEELQVGAPIAVLCEDEEAVEGLADHVPPYSDLEGQGVPVGAQAIWQAYFKNPEDKAQGCD
ncbi:unnamed protein product [Pedinophyceae sp. YPF-701]|nr:unnamed protein product [Pedinophyceae sp. YPF-701]